MKKRLLVAVAFVAVLGLAIAGAASADGGPHGGYTSSTDACAGCHRAHTGSGANLITATDTQALCLTCHGASATGARTNVIIGVYEATAGDDSGTPLLGGLFNAGTVTSSHDVTGTVRDVWGATARGVSEVNYLATGLDCGSCHDPHGTSGYRLLTAGSVPDYDVASKDYTADTWTDNKLNDFCSSCHVEYHETAVNVGNDTGAQTYAGTYTHRVGMTWNDTTGVSVDAASFASVSPETSGLLPLSTVTGNEQVVCTTCHFSHGTSAVSDGDADGTDYGSDGPAGDTALVRLDGRGVCQACHEKGNTAKPVVVIDAPADLATLAKADPNPDFLSTASDADDTGLSDADVVWRIDGTTFGTGDLTGFDISGWANGAHEITASVTDSYGWTTTATITVTVTD